MEKKSTLLRLTRIKALVTLRASCHSLVQYREIYAYPSIYRHCKAILTHTHTHSMYYTNIKIQVYTSTLAHTYVHTHTHEKEGERGRERCYQQVESYLPCINSQATILSLSHLPRQKANSLKLKHTLYTPNTCMYVRMYLMTTSMYITSLASTRREGVQ